MPSSPQPLRGRAALERLIAPRRVALVGASARPGSFGARVLSHMQGFEGTLYPINPRYPTLEGRPCFPSLAALPEPPDCVILAIPREGVAAAFEEAVAAGAGGVVVFASGYAETSRPERRAEQDLLARRARESGIPLLGPNCIGLVNYPLGAAMTFSAVPKPAMPLPERCVGIVSQSGALGFALALATEHGVPVSHVLTAGNAADVDMADLVAYLAEEPRCGAIACLFEGMSAPRRLMAAAERALAAGKRVVVHKLATSAQGARAALSHTGSLAGAEAAYRAAFRRAGMIMVETFEDLMETAAFFAKAPAPRGHGVAVVASSGGAAIMAADAAAEQGVPLPEPTPATLEVLRARIPEFGTAGNPCDVTAQVLTDPESLAACSRALLAEPAIAALIVPAVYSYEPVRARILAFDELAAEAGKLICNVWINERWEGPGALEAAASPHSVLFRSMRRCFATLAHWLAPPPRRGGTLPLIDGAARAKVAAELAHAPSRLLGEGRAKALLAHYGIPAVAEAAVSSLEEARARAAELGWPVVLKLDSEAAPHKTEAGLVRLGLADEAALAHAFAELDARRAALGGALLLQPMIRPGVELFLGGRVDPLFGPLVLVGIGGVLVELLGDTALTLAPCTVEEAEALIGELRLAPLLEGFRGGPAVSRRALAEIVARFSVFLADHAEALAEVDINPLIGQGEKIVMVDALITRP
jgi:acyl-CoA synthetase (NDP forming)